MFVMLISCIWIIYFIISDYDLQNSCSFICKESQFLWLFTVMILNPFDSFKEYFLYIEQAWSIDYSACAFITMCLLTILEWSQSTFYQIL